MSNTFPWYDSRWLKRYIKAKDIINEFQPTKLDQFVQSMSVFRTDPSFSVVDVPDIFDHNLLSEIRNEIRSIPMDKMEMHEIKKFGRFVVHNLPYFNELQSNLTDLVSQKVKEPVEPSYNFLSLYTKMGICEPHLDAPSAKWTLDICINQSDIWPIYFSQVVNWPEDGETFDDDWRSSIKTNKDLSYTEKHLTPGNGIIFSGSSQWHYRNALPATKEKNFCDLLFFHFIPKGTAQLADPRNWADLFDIPELSKLYEE